MWTDWHPFGKLDGDLTVDALRQHEIMVVAVMGKFSNVRFRFQTGTTTWSDWESLERPPSDGFLRSLALRQNFDHRLEVFVAGQDGTAWHRWELEGWSEWTPMGLPHGDIFGLLVVGRDAEKRLEAFCVGTVPGSEQALWHRWQKKPGSDWAAWDSLDAPPGGPSDPVLGRNADGRLEVFCVTPDRSELWHRWQRHAGKPDSWDRPWEKLGDRPGGIGEVAVGLNADDLLTLVATARDGRDLWQRTQAPATDPMPGGWGPWERLPAVPTAPVDSPLLYRNRRGGLGLFLRTPSTGGLYQLTQPTLGGAWTGRRWSSPQPRGWRRPGRHEIFPATTDESSKKGRIKAGPHGLSRAPGAITPKIVGGQPVPNGKYKFQAALLAQSFGSNDFERQYCGGSLITPFEVLTAAHCVEFIGDEPGMVPLSDLRVVVGRTVLTSTQGQKRRAAAIDIHPRWDPVNFSFDVAVVHLASPINGITPILLVTPGVDALERPGTLATVTGWGNTIQQPAGPGGGGVNYPDRMREAQVPIVSRPECQTVYANVDAPIDATMLCAGRTNLDTCQGDSGGPLFFKAVGGGFIQAGITSWGFGCGATGFPGVYTRLSNRGVGNFVLSATGGVPVNAAQAA